MNLQAMRDLVRTQLDLDDTDLPNPLLDVYLQEGYDRVLELEARWPFFESMWQVTTETDGTMPMPTDARFIEMIITEEGRLLRRIAPRLSVLSFPPTTSTGSPGWWSRLNREVFVKPSPGVNAPLTIIGYRTGSDWISQGASSECDCDRLLHIPICWYACSLGYAQQEDEVLEATYLNRFKESSAQARESIMRSNQALPHQVAHTHYPLQPTGPRDPAQLILQPPAIIQEDDTIIGGTP